jgi:hypothetical protein
MIGPAQGTVNTSATNQVSHTELCHNDQSPQFSVWPLLWQLTFLLLLLKTNVDI